MKHSVYISHMRKLRRKLSMAFTKKKRSKIAKELSTYASAHRDAALESWYESIS